MGFVGVWDQADYCRDCRRFRGRIVECGTVRTCIVESRIVFVNYSRYAPRLFEIVVNSVVLLRDYSRIVFYPTVTIHETIHE